MSRPLPDDLRDSLWRYLGQLDSSTRRKAREYVNAGRVLSASVNPDAIEGAVRGGATYHVTLLREGKRANWDAECECPVAFDCKHCGALVMALLDAATAQDGDLRGSSAPSARPSQKVRGSFRALWTPKIEEKLGRSLTAEEGYALGQLSALFADFKSTWNRLSVSALHRHGFRVPEAERSDVYGHAYEGWWGRTTPPADPWQLWQYLAADLEMAGREIPEVFRPMTEDTSAIRQRVEERKVAAELEQWRRFSAAAAGATTPPRPKIAGLLLRWTREGWQLETQAAASKPFKPVSNAWLRKVGYEGGLSDFAHLPPAQAALGAIVVATVASGGNPSYDAVDEIAEAAIASPAAVEAVAVLDAPWQIAPEVLTWQSAISSTQPARLEFLLAGPDGEPADDAVPMLLGAEGNYYYWRDRVHRGPPPLPAPSAPLRALEDESVRRLLRARAVRLPDALAGKFRRVELRTRFECSLAGPPGGERNYFTVRVFAAADAPPCERQLRAHEWHWTKHGTPPQQDATDPLLEFEAVAPDAIRSHLAQFRLNWFQYYEGWVRPLTRNFPEEFLAWRATLPADIAVVLAPELAGLAAPPMRARLDLVASAAEGARDWFDVTVALRVEDTTLTPDEIALLLKARGKWVHLPRVGFRRAELATDGPATETLARLGLTPGDVGTLGKPVRHRLHALQLAGEADALDDAKLAAALRARAAALTRVSAPVPPALRAELRPYQREGYEFLAFLSANGFGGVLADDMGLGKTVQTLAWLLWLATRERRTARSAFRALVVCPKSVVHGWIAESARFAPTLSATAFAPALTEAKRAPAGLTIANYTQVRLQGAWFQSLSWDAVVLDEGQFIKNPASQIAGIVRALPAAHRVVLAGTPIENRLLDLWSLFAFAQPGLLGSQAEFRRQYPATDPAAHARLRCRTRHFLLRRTKGQVATDLPPRTEDDLHVDLEPEQEKLYRAELKRARQQLLGIDTDRALDRVRFNVLASLLRLRQICCHPALVDPAHAELPSAKLEALLERLEELREEGHQVLVFSQFVEMLELIRLRLVQADIGHLMLTGATENRAERVEEFQRDRSRTVFLLSLKAAGFGLNLTAASYAILYDPWWNPAVEAQAIDRTHRIGQTKPVIAYRLLARNTVEEKIRALQREKAELARGVVQEESLASVLDLDSLRKILA